VSPNLCALAIYLQLVFAFGNRLKVSMNVNAKMTMFVFFHKHEVLGEGHYHWLKGINLLSMQHKEKYHVHTICQLNRFLLL
jgi:hypothetical protein